MLGTKGNMNCFGGYVYDCLRRNIKKHFDDDYDIHMIFLLLCKSSYANHVFNIFQELRHKVKLFILGPLSLERLRA